MLFPARSGPLVDCGGTRGLAVNRAETELRGAVVSTIEVSVFVSLGSGKNGVGKASADDASTTDRARIDRRWRDEQLSALGSPREFDTPAESEYFRRCASQTMAIEDRINCWLLRPEFRVPDPAHESEATPHHSTFPAPRFALFLVHWIASWALRV